jgi:hypothetical protein
MHKYFYASGFLYYPPSDQILLQAPKDSGSPSWSLLGAIGASGDKPEEVFLRVIRELLQTDVTSDTIRPVYNYFHTEMKKDQHVFYAQVKTKPVLPDGLEANFAWFTDKQISKLPLSKQTRHDIIIGQRVISALERKRLGQHTFE